MSWTLAVAATPALHPAKLPIRHVLPELDPLRPGRPARPHRETQERPKVIVVPGYGMALAQAQADVKLMDLLEEGGAG